MDSGEGPVLLGLGCIALRLAQLSKQLQALWFRLALVAGFQPINLISGFG